MDTKLKHSVDADRVLIESLGGPTRLAELLGFPKTGGVQRVQNWKDRGIPASIKIAYPHIFLVGIRAARQELHRCPTELPQQSQTS